MRRHLAPYLIALASLSLAPAATALLFGFAQLGQRPPEALQGAVVVLLGVLLGTPLTFMRRRLPRALQLSTLAPGAVLAVVVALGLERLFPIASETGAMQVILSGQVPAGAGGAALVGLASSALSWLVSSAWLALGGRRTELYAGASVFVVCTVLANYTLDSFIPLGDFFLVNVGTLFFGITFTQRDRLHHFGRPVVYRLILMAGIGNVIAALSLGTPLRYVAVSFLAIVVSDSANTEVYHRLLRLRWVARVASSNAVAAPLDTIVFTTLAFAGEPFATLRWMTQVIVTDVLVKYGASMVAAITILSRPEWIPKAPGEDAPLPAEAEAQAAAGDESLGCLRESQRLAVPAGRRGEAQSHRQTEPV